MDDIEIMKRAKQYIESLANGIDPLTGNEIADDDIVNNVRISRCLFYTAGVLQKVIDNGGEILRERQKRSGKADFALTDEQALALEPDEADLTVSKVADIINSKIDENVMRTLKAAVINRWLIQKGLLTEVTINGRQYKHATSAGESIGIKLIDRVSQTGIPYKQCVYSPEAQRFIFDNIDAITAFTTEEEEERSAAKAERKRLAAEYTE